jgi:hypothetical protein
MLLDELGCADWGGQSMPQFESHYWNWALSNLTNWQVSSQVHVTFMSHPFWLFKKKMNLQGTQKGLNNGWRRGSVYWVSVHSMDSFDFCLDQNLIKFSILDNTFILVL